MTFNVKKIISDDDNHGYAISDDVTDDGTIFEVSSNDLILKNSINGGIGLFDIDIDSLVSSGEDNYFPSNSSRIDTYFELDGNNDLIPKE